MESFGAFSNEEWESFRIMFSDDQNTLFSQDHHHGFNFENEVNINANSLLITNDDHYGYNGYVSENSDPNLYHNYFSQETNNINSCVETSLSYPSTNINPLPSISYNENNNNSLLAQILSDYSMEEILCMRDQDIDNNIKTSVDHPSVQTTDDQLKHTTTKRKIEMSESLDAIENKVNDDEENPKKKTRVTRDNKNKKKAQPKKKQKIMEGNVNEDENNIAIEDTNANNNKGGANAPIASSSSCSSEDDSTVNSNWKTRAGRGAATDPQSLYARKRRERINERLKVLQNLVPNGTKVDISTMLEEAVQYVKFLQLQIKLLSSDDMWMYAPIAYNGMDMGLYQKLQQS